MIATDHALERRHRPRLRLAYTVRLTRLSGGAWIETTTEDISCEGFFCVTDAALSPREILACELVLAPESERAALQETIILRCRAEVVRVERRNDKSCFGVACRLSDYTIECRLSQQELSDSLLDPA
jgi:hypothetical protein